MHFMGLFCIPTNNNEELLAYINLTLPGSPSKSLRIKDMTPDETKNLHLKGNIALFAHRSNAWRGKTMSTSERIYGGVKCKIHVASDDPDKDVKLSAVSEAIDRCISVAGLSFPRSTVEFYIHGQNQACLGYILPMMPENKFCIILGTGVMRTKVQLVSTIIKESSKEGPQRAQQLCATTAVIHELGHCFHQLLNPSQYYCVSQACILKGKAGSELSGEYRERWALLCQASTKDMEDFTKAAKSFGAEVSKYASTHPNEFVAECFAGQVMGLTYGEDVMSAYATLGGPPVRGVAAVGKGRPRGHAFVAPPEIEQEGEGL